MSESLEMAESSSREDDRRIFRGWSSLRFRVLGGVLLFLLCFVGHWIWKTSERAAAVEQCEGNGGTVDYGVIYPNWVRSLGIESWFNEKTFRKIDTLNYAYDADLGRLNNAFDLQHLHTLNPLNAGECSAEGLQPLSRFPELITLSLTGDMINSEVLKQTTELAYLSSLNLDCGDLDDEGLRHLANHPQLGTLGISNCDLDSVTPGNFSKFPQLNTFWLSNLEISDPDLTGFSQSTQLERLVMHNVELSPTGFEEVAKLPRLQELELYGPDITPEKLARFAKARKAHYFEYQHIEIPEASLDRMLQHQYQVKGRWKSSSQTSRLVDQAKLYSIFLELADIPFQSSGERHSKMWLFSYSPAESELLGEELTVLIQGDYLETLVLRNISIHSQLKETLVGLKKLKELTLKECSFSNETLKQLQANLPNCRIKNQSSKVRPATDGS